MKDETSEGLIILITVLATVPLLIAWYGEPDLVDALIYWLMKG